MISHEAAEDQARLSPDRFFDGWLIARTEAATTLVSMVVTDLETYEQANAIRKRRRKATDQTIFEAIVQSVILDLAHAHLMIDERPCAIPRTKQVLDAKDRYKAPALSGTLPETLDLLQVSGWIQQSLGKRNAQGQNQRTTISPTPRLLQAIADHGITPSDIGRSKAEEVLILKSVKEDYWDKGEYVPYVDDQDTHRIRQQVQTINDWIAAARIEFDDAALERNITVDPSDTRLRRYFSRCSFESGGRLFGGFWQRLSENERLNGILINGEEVVEIDYGQMAARILYGLAGSPVPQGDLYAIPGLTTAEGNPCRDGIKLLFNSLTFMEHEPTRKPKKSKGKLPSGMRVEQIVDLIKQAHPAISSYFGTPTGHYVQFRESEVMVNVLLRLREDNIVALPVHDAIIVPCSAKVRAMEIMKSVFEEIIGVEITLKCDTRNDNKHLVHEEGLVPLHQTQGLNINVEPKLNKSFSGAHKGSLSNPTRQYQGSILA
jgi:hypothetical protein